ncbi:hypothetical protein RhiJN_00049 [Ceratobasidium sp. AG-Ba]|nr:hypothetical protein RhiJN_00049 [Ceratobasidium sp. AG-Ba]QRW01088.1 hypothetical protein RhiLY_00085 [Ceratobasidium sp. AG-Ba]QRW01092.1 hypothetical protein RhiLY_00089 [Ceratobasidium sp. AG-Ba]
MSSNVSHRSDFYRSNLRRLYLIERFGMEESPSRGFQLARGAGTSHQQQQWQRQPSLHAGSDSHSVLSSGGRFSPVRVSGKYRASPYLAPGGPYGRPVLNTPSLAPSTNAFLQSIQSPSNLTPHLAPWTAASYNLSPGNSILWNNPLATEFQPPSDAFDDDLSFYLNHANALTLQEDRNFCPTPAVRSSPPRPAGRSVSNSNSTALTHDLASHGAVRAAPSYELYSETQPTHADHSASSYTGPAHVGPSPSPSTNTPTRQVGLGGLPRLSESLTHDITSYKGVTMSSNLEIIVQAILSTDPMYLSPDAEKAYQEGKSAHTRWTNYEKNKFVRHLCETLTVLPQNIKRFDEASGTWSNFSEKALNNRRPPSALLSQYEKMEIVYFNILTFFRKTPTDSTVAILGAIENTIVSAGILGVRSCPVKTADLVAWVAGGTGSWFAVLHDKLSGNPDVSERLRRFQEKTVTPNSGLAASTVVSSEVSSRLLIDRNSAVSSTPPPPHRPNLSSFAPHSGEQPCGIAVEIDRADRAATAEVMREEVAVIRADTGLLLRQSRYLDVLTLKAEAGIARTIISDDIAERDKKFERCKELLSLLEPTIDEGTVKAANECLREYISTPAPSTMYPAVLRQIRGEPSTDELTTEYALDPDLLGPPVDELASSPHHGSVVVSLEQPGTPPTELPAETSA